MPRPTNELLKVARTLVSDLNEEVTGLREKVAQFERKELAEDIASMKIAMKVISTEEYLDEVQDLLESGDDLAQVKIALKHGGGRAPARTLASTGEQEADTKTASKNNRGEPKEHVKRAAQELEAVMASLDGSPDLDA